MTCSSDCVVAYSLPTSKEGFTWLQRQPHADYVKRFRASGWCQYAAVCSSLRDGIDLYAANGVTQICEELRANQWPTLFSKGSVVILFAHWVTEAIGAGEEAKQTVEFWDERLPLESVVAGIPRDFSGVLDLSVCHPHGLVDQIARTRPHCTVCYIPFKVSPTVWSQMYGTVFQVLSGFEANYTDVLSKVVVEYRQQSLQRKGWRKWIPKK